MPSHIDHIIDAIMKSKTLRKARDKKGRAIAIAKSRGLVKQKGKHLAAGPKAKP